MYVPVKHDGGGRRVPVRHASRRRGCCNIRERPTCDPKDAAKEAAWGLKDRTGAESATGAAYGR